MKAIVLTYDKYHPIADHMIQSYMELWPDNPFVFRVPYQTYPESLKKKYGSKIELIQTPKGIKDTMIALLQDIEDDEWVYWCMDDRYPIKVDVKKLDEFYSLLRAYRADGLSFVLSNKDCSIKYSNVFKIIKADNRNKFYRKKHFGSIWSHQFMKAKVLRYFFENMSVSINTAKDMDHYLLKESVLPKKFKMLVTTRSHAQFGESSTRGMLTKNCHDSMMDSKIQPPAEFKITGERIIPNSDDGLKNPVLWRIKDIAKFILNR